MEGLGGDVRFASFIAGALASEPFTLVDVGCSGGIDTAFRAFGAHLVAVGFDPNIEEIERLRRSETSGLVTFVDAFVDGGSDYELIIEGNPWQRLSVARTLEIRQPSLAEYSSSQRTTNNLWTETRLAERSVQLPDFLKSLSVTDIDFIKIDVDGADFAILQSCADMLHESGVLGLGIEVNFHGDASPDTNTFHNVDRFMRDHGYALFDLSVRRYSSRALPSRYQLTIPAQTEFGRIAQGDALYLRDACAGPLAGSQSLTAAKLLKLAALFSLFGMPDGGAAILCQFADVLEGEIDCGAGLDLLAAQADPDGSFRSYRSYIDAFEKDDRRFWPALAQGAGHRTSDGESAQMSGDQEQGVTVDWTQSVVPGPAGFRTPSGQIESLAHRGHVAFGPNARLDPGAYEARIIVRVRPRMGFGRSRAYVDVAIAGEQVASLAVPRKPGVHLLPLPFAVRPSDAASGVEVRLHTNGRPKLVIESIELAATDASMADPGESIRGQGESRPHEDPCRFPAPFASIPGRAPVLLPGFYEEFRHYYPRAELQTRRWFVENVRPDWVVFDVGANVGVYSVLAGQLASDGRVFAFEPTSTSEMLERNLSANGVEGVTVVRRAVSNATGRRRDKIYRIWGQAPDEGDFDFVTLDDFCETESLQRIDLIKIDVDGFELEALLGARRILDRFRPVLIVEINHALRTGDVDPTDVLQQLATLGYQEATVLDRENYLLRPVPVTEFPPTSQTPMSVRVGFDRRPVLAPEEFAPGEVLARIPLEPRVHEGGSVRMVEGGLEVTAAGDRWSYAASFDGAQVSGFHHPVVVSVGVSTESGVLGVGIYDEQMKELIEPEVFRPAPSASGLDIVCRTPARAGHLVIRNAHRTGEESRGVVSSIAIREAVPAGVGIRHWDAADRVDVADIARRCGVRRGRRDEAVVGIVGVEDLHVACDFRRAFIPPRLVIPYGLGDFTMERDDAPILAYLYSEHSPRRHFEFGTWEGFGALLCAESSEAQVWTLNLSDGERDEFGNLRYGTESVASDAGDRIGWRYREAGLQGRVHQLYGDSRDLDTEHLGRGSFDSVLVDGGHTSDVVESDTRKAIELLRPGGWLIWHDFAPDEIVLQNSEAARGVVGAFADHLASWSEFLERPFWVRPSNLCLARRKDIL